MDYDGDGIMDIVSGSYDPGDIYLMRGQGGGKYDAATTIKDKAGLPLVHHPVELAKFNAWDPEKRNDDDALRVRVATFGSWPTFVDWDADGDLDILIGTFRGEIYRRMNVGTAKKPEFDPAAIRIDVDRRPLLVNRHAVPIAADWDGDGLFDLVVGVSDGAVVWFKNRGQKGAPEFESARSLLPPRSTEKFLMQTVKRGELPGPGVRAQIAVVDYDVDGRLDLLVGDYTDVVEKPADDVATTSAPSNAESVRQSYVWFYRRTAPK